MDCGSNFPQSPDVASEASIAEKIAKIANQHCMQLRPRSLSRDRADFLREQDTTKMNYERIDKKLRGAKFFRQDAGRATTQGN
jgi:hypothetical protein